MFFFDGTKEVHCSKGAGGINWQDDSSSQTASSSGDSMILDQYDCLPSRPCAWEDIGDIDHASSYSAMPSEETVSPLLSTDPAVNVDRDTLEVCEIDVIEVRWFLPVVG